MFEEDYGVRLPDAGTTDIVEDMTSLKFLATNSIATYTRYIRVGKVMIKHR